MLPYREVSTICLGYLALATARIQKMLQQVEGSSAGPHSQHDMVMGLFVEDFNVWNILTGNR